MKIVVVSNCHKTSKWAHSINLVKYANIFLKLGHEIRLLNAKRYKKDKLLNKINDIYNWYGIYNLLINYFKDNLIQYFKEEKNFKKTLKLFNKKYNPKNTYKNYFANFFHLINK